MLPKAKSILFALLLLAPPLAWGQTIAQKPDTSPSTSRLEREIEDKKDEIRQRRALLRNLRNVGDAVSTAISKIDSTKYPDQAAKLLSQLQTDAPKVKTLDEAKAVIKLLSDARDLLYQTRRSVQGLVDPDDTIFSAEERKLLRPLKNVSVDGTELRPSLRRRISIDVLFGDETAGLKELFPDAPKKLELSATLLAEAARELSKERFDSFLAQTRQPFAEIQKTVERELSDSNRFIAAANDEIDKAAAALEKSREQSNRVDQTLITFALPGLAIVMIGLLIAPRIYKNDALHLEAFKSGLLLELFTVFFITATILILGLSSKIDAPILGTLLGGISGYILGRSTTKDKSMGGSSHVAENHSKAPESLPPPPSKDA
jgi:hypothetical protein